MNILHNKLKKRMNISVIIATYNRCESLKDTLENLLSQICHNEFSYEVIVVDNNSNDKTKQVVESYVERFNDGLRYLFEPKQGKPYALNHGIREAKGDIIAFTDDDCVLKSDYLSMLHESFKENGSEIEFMGGKILPKWLSDDIPMWLTDFFMGPLGLLDYGDEAFAIDYSKEDHDKRLFFGANMAFKRSVFDRFGSFDLTKTYAQDTEICLRLFESGVKGLYSPSVQVFHKVPASRMKPKYFYRWFYRRGYFREKLDGYNVKFYHPFGIPNWFIVQTIKEFIQSFREKSEYSRILHRCRCSLYLGMMARKFKNNLFCFT